MNISKILDENISYLENAFLDCADVIKRKFPVGEENPINCYVIYIDNMTNKSDIETCIMRGLIWQLHKYDSKLLSSKDKIFDDFKNSGIITADIKEATQLEDATLSVMSGDTVLFIDGVDKVMVVSTKGWDNRGVPEAKTEAVVFGSKEAFSENIRTNTVLIRRRIRDVNLKVKQLVVGKRSKTDIALMYLDDIVRKEILEEVMEKINAIDIDAILDIGYIEQFIEDSDASPFPQLETTERPDKAASAILEGRIAIVVDNSPFVLIVPSTMNVFFQSSEDYYQKWQIMSFTRILRYIAGFLSISLPGLYIATAVYHPSMLPMDLTFKIAGSRANVPFPAVIEILIMDIAFELLKEAGVRLPGAIGSTIGIVGGIIIGQSAVDAGLVSPIVVIVIALTGICSFTIPNVALVSGFRLSKYLLIFTSACFGLFGFWIGILILLIHLASLKSFGIPYLFPFVSGEINNFRDMKDSIIRFPLCKMKYRPIFASPKADIRFNKSKLVNQKKRE